MKSQAGSKERNESNGSKGGKMFQSGIAMASMGVMVMFGNTEAWANGLLSVGVAPGGGTPPTAGAAAAAGAFVSSQQAQIQNQIQIQNDSQIQAASSTARGGEGGSAHNAGNSQIVNLGSPAMRNNPNIGLGLIAPTAPCRDTYSLGASAAGMGGAMAWSKADRECRLQDIGAAFIRAGFIEDGLALWCSIDGVDDIAPTCKRLRAIRQAAEQVAGMLGTRQENVNDETINEFIR